MQQLEIQYFYPLTEQIPLDLDFTPCDKYAEYLRRKQSYVGYNFDTWSINNGVLTSTGTGTTICNIPTTIQFHPSNESAGYWKVGEGLQMHNKKKPNWLHRQMSKIFFGWDWKNK